MSLHSIPFQLSYFGEDHGFILSTSTSESKTGYIGSMMPLYAVKSTEKSHSNGHHRT